MIGDCLISQLTSQGMLISQGSNRDPNAFMPQLNVNGSFPDKFFHVTEECNVALLWAFLTPPQANGGHWIGSPIVASGW